MSMTRKDYELIADAIYATHKATHKSTTVVCTKCRGEVALSVASALKSANLNFDAMKFLVAATQPLGTKPKRAKAKVRVLREKAPAHPDADKPWYGPAEGDA